MGISLWTLLFAADTLFCLWVMRWGGAEWMEGWRAVFFIDWFAGHWHAEQIKLYVLLWWILHALWFVLGLVVPGARFSVGLGLI